MLITRITRIFIIECTILIIFTCFGLTHSVHAQEQPASAIRVSPAIIELIAAPGEIVETTLEVTNIADVPIPLKASPQAFAEIPSTVDSAHRQAYDSSRWITLIEPDFILEPGESQTVRVAVSVPDSAEPGGHYATVYIRSLIPADFVSESRLYLTARVGVLAFFIIKGDIQENADFPILTSAHFASHLPVTFSTQIKNTGNVHILPSGAIHVYDWKNQEIDQIPIKPQIILPGETASIYTEWSPSTLFGQYTAQSEIRYGTDQTIMNSGRISLWVSPLMPLIGSISGVFVFLIIVLLYRRRIWLALNVLLGRQRS
ncbi:hypothetical protein HGA91_05110 [candidate division WWE3 bacterium]|nr:hypothetical protein [candidate division WWE3 bacterium]